MLCRALYPLVRREPRTGLSITLQNLVGRERLVVNAREQEQDSGLVRLVEWFLYGGKDTATGCIVCGSEDSGVILLGKDGCLVGLGDMLFFVAPQPTYCRPPVSWRLVRAKGVVCVGESFLWAV